MTCPYMKDAYEIKSYTTTAGTTVRKWFTEDGNRYKVDRVCRSSAGWRQYDTREDAWYFGIWIHIADRKVVTYAEGDIREETCPDVETFRGILAEMDAFYGDPPPAFTTIDLDGSVTHYVEERPTV